MGFGAMDLRDRVCFAEWFATLPADLRDLLQQASQSYFEFDDTISIVFTNEAAPLLRETDVHSCLTAHIAAFFDRNRKQWLAKLPDPGRGDAPPSVVMPRVRFDIVPPRHAGH